jgi:hypothetical protein
MPECDVTYDKLDEIWSQVFQKAVLESTKAFQISELEAKAIFEKVDMIPRS